MKHFIRIIIFVIGLNFIFVCAKIITSNRLTISKNALPLIKQRINANLKYKNQYSVDTLIYQPSGKILVSYRMNNSCCEDLQNDTAEWVGYKKLIAIRLNKIVSCESVEF